MCAPLRSAQGRHGERYGPLASRRCASWPTVTWSAAATHDSCLGTTRGSLSSWASSNSPILQPLTSHHTVDHQPTVPTLHYRFLLSPLSIITVTGSRWCAPWQHHPTSRHLNSH
jgi:hypothetical protein